MKILYINDNDLAGRRFNGHDLQIMLNGIDGFSAKQLVVSKAGDDKNTIPIINTEGGYFVREKCIEFQNSISMQSVVYPFGEIIEESEAFKEADIVHYHLIFNYFMSLYSFKKLAQIKPTIWTLHDPWAMTGHCVYPVDCKGWLTGCKKCPYLDRYAPLEEDNAYSIWNIKKDIYKDLVIDIVVASQWMYDMVKKSPLTKGFDRVHLIPFGIDLKLFKRKKNRDEIREKLGIGKESFVIMFRQAKEWKGVTEIKKMLKNLNIKNPITLLTVGSTGMIDEFKDKYQVIENEWVNDNSLMVDLYSASDLFLMPSIAESFGLMAIEAMACSLPVIVFEGTSLPSVTFSPKCGIALKRESTEEFVKTVTRLIFDPKECVKRGEMGRQLAEKHYDIGRYHKEMINLYNDIFNKIKKEIK